MSTTSAPADAVQAIEEGLARLGTSFRDAFASAPTEQALRLEHAKAHAWMPWQPGGFHPPLERPGNRRGVPGGTGKDAFTARLSSTTGTGRSITARGSERSSRQMPLSASLIIRAISRIWMRPCRTPVCKADSPPTWKVP